MASSAALLDQLSTAILILDLKGRFYFLNASAEKALGITARNLIGKRFNYFIEAETLPVRQWLSQLNSYETKIFDNRLIQFKNDLTIEAELALQKIQWGEHDYLLIEWQNSSAAKRHKQEQELVQQQQVQQQLLQTLAHEIKTPLSGIAGAAQLIALGSEQDSQVSHIIQKEVKRLAQLVDRMLLGQQKASRLLINIHEIIEDVISFIQLESNPDLIIHRDYDPSLPDLEVAPEQLYQVFLNLAQNALDALTHTKSPQLTFKTRMTKEHPLNQNVTQAICISLADNGVGIAKELQANIFFPMISGKNSSGLGLGIAQILIGQHQGVIEFTSKPGATEFYCYLPLSRKGSA